MNGCFHLLWDYLLILFYCRSNLRLICFPGLIPSRLYILCSWEVHVLCIIFFLLPGIFFFSGIEFFSCVVYFFLFYEILLPKKRFDTSLCWRSKERRKGEGERRRRGIRRRRKRNSSSSSSLGGQWLNRQRERCLPPILTTWFNSRNQHGKERAPCW